MKVKEELLIDKPDVDDIAELEIVEDFLPPPQALAEAKRIVTLSIPINLETLEFYRLLAQTRKLPLKVLIQQILEAYAIQQGMVDAKSVAVVAAD